MILKVYQYLSITLFILIDFFLINKRNDMYSVFYNNIHNKESISYVIFILILTAILIFFNDIAIGYFNNFIINKKRLSLKLINNYSHDLSQNIVSDQKLYIEKYIMFFQKFLSSVIIISFFSYKLISIVGLNILVCCVFLLI